MESEPKLSPLRHNENGEEILDETARNVPLQKHTPSLFQQQLDMVRRVKLELLRDQDVSESEEEADDFEVGEDFTPLSRYENDHIPSIKVLKKKAKEINDQIIEKNRRAAIAAHEKALKDKSTTPQLTPEPTPQPKSGSE